MACESCAGGTDLSSGDTCSACGGYNPPRRIPIHNPQDKGEEEFNEKLRKKDAIHSTRR